MSNKDWNQLGHDIFDTVQQAIESCDFSKLSKDISDAVNTVVDDVSSSIRQASGAQYRKQQEIKKKPLKQTGLIVKPNKAGWNMLRVIGIAGGIGCGIWAVMQLISALPIILAGGSALALASVLSPTICTGLFSIAGAIGGAGVKQIGRFYKYVDEVGYREYAQIEDLAGCVSKDNKYVAKDLQKMIQKGWFVQGHLDRQKTCLIVTNEMYKQYKETQYQYETSLVKQNQRQYKYDSFDNHSKAAARDRSHLSEEVRGIIDQGDEFVRKIRKCNDDIPGEEISAKIDRMEMIVDKIFDRVEQNPQSVKDIRKLMEYYLPTTVKLLEAYADMDAQPIGGENIKAAKAEIEASLDTLNAAFEKLLDDMFQDTAWDVSTDISVLNTMLAQEGLKKDLHMDK